MDVAAWLQDLGLERCVPAFRDNDIDAEGQPKLTAEDLGEEPADQAQLKSLLVPYPSGDMIAWPVSTRVGSVKNNDPSLVEPITLPAV